ncbi:MAG TPA: VOC family protein, partial [Ignavibacteria bacterium]|nr:VOC family protein [Ignavibacteria bacterium]
MSNPIYPCLWFDNQAKEAAEYYCSVFDNSKMLSENPIVVQFEIAGKKILGLNGGPLFKINPSISLFITCDTDEEIESIWKKLSDGGKIMMAFDKYPWSEKYGWVADKFGMTWQIIKSYAPGSGQTIIPSFLFVGEQYGKAQ